MNENVKWFAAAVGVVGLAIAAVVYRDSWWRDRPKPPAEPAVSVPAATEPADAVPDEPAVKHPLPTAETQEEALPSLTDSDRPVQQALTELIGPQPVERFIIPNELIRHVVVSIDNLTTEKVAERIRPVKPVAGAFEVAGPEESPVLDPANYVRYEPLVQVIRSTDTARLAAIYTRYYPLFQEAYESLGHPPEYFNDRMIEVIDHLLETPDVSGPIALTRPNVLYEFADPALESRSAGQKALIRMGTNNANAVKAKLRELRSALVVE